MYFLRPYQGLLREPPARTACSGEYGNALRHWLSFSYSDVGFAGNDQVSPHIHYLTSTAVFASPLTVMNYYIREDYPGSRYYRTVYMKENRLGECLSPIPFLLHDPLSCGVRVLKRDLDREANGATILAEPVLPCAPPDLGVPCGSWRYLFKECVEKHGDLVAAKCEYQRCKLYECTANYYKNNAAVV